MQVPTCIQPTLIWRKGTIFISEAHFDFHAHILTIPCTHFPIGFCGMRALEGTSQSGSMTPDPSTLRHIIMGNVENLLCRSTIGHAKMPAHVVIRL